MPTSSARSPPTQNSLLVLLSVNLAVPPVGGSVGPNRGPAPSAKPAGARREACRGPARSRPHSTGAQGRVPRWAGSEAGSRPGLHPNLEFPSLRHKACPRQARRGVCPAPADCSPQPRTGARGRGRGRHTMVYVMAHIMAYIMAHIMVYITVVQKGLLLWVAQRGVQMQQIVCALSVECRDNFASQRKQKLQVAVRRLAGTRIALY